MINRDAGLKVVERNEFSRIIDDILTKTQNEREQVQLCLNHLHNPMEETHRITRNKKLYDFIGNHEMYIGWSKKIKNKLDGGFNILNNWKHFFFSYTSRGNKSMNHVFSELIEDYKKQWTRPWLNDQNCHQLAYIIHEKIYNNNLSSYFDYKDIASGQKIEDDVRKACESAFAFIQIIEESSFVNHDTKNWCHLEYEFFKQSNDKLLKLIDDDQIFEGMHFIILSKDLDEILPVNLNGYSEWVERIKVLKHTNLYDEKYELALKTKLKESIAKNIMERRKQVINALLNN